MKVTMDGVNLPVANSRGNQINRESLPQGRKAVKTDNLTLNNPNSINLKTTNEKSLGDALSIAQMSQNIIQKAIIASLRLKSIASKAMNTGKVDSQELTDAISQIQSSITEYGEKIAIPVQTLSKENQFSDAQNEFQSLKKTALEFNDNISRNPLAIDQVSNQLTEKNSVIERGIVDIKNSMIEISKEYPAIQNNINKLNSDTIEMITGNSGKALVSQGNINPQVASHFI